VTTVISSTDTIFTLGSGLAAPEGNLMGLTNKVANLSLPPKLPPVSEDLHVDPDPD